MLLEEVERVKRESEKAVAEAEEMAKALRNAEEQKKVSDKKQKATFSSSRVPYEARRTNT